MDIEKRLKKEIEDSAPNVLDGILSACKDVKGCTKMKKQKKILPVIAAAAAFALIFGTVFGIMVHTNANAVDSVVSIDVNPSVELQLNKKEKVVSFMAVNDDGAEILKDIDIKGMSVETAVENVLDTMKDKGYMDGDKSSVLISVKNKNQKNADKLSDKLLDHAYESMGKNHSSPAVLSQSLSDGDSSKEIAKKYGLSHGKAKLITKIMEKDSLLTIDKLAGLPMNDLNLLIQQNGIELDGIKCKGTATDTTYITAEAAKLSAFAEAGVKETDVTDIKVKMDCDHRTMVYEVEFTVDGIEYEYEISAQTGEILDFEADGEKGSGDGKEEGKKPNVDTSSFIGEEAALAAAGEAFSKVDTADMIDSKVKLDEEDGVYVYEITIKTNSKKYEYSIDAVSGEILYESVKNTGKYENKNENKNENNGNSGYSNGNGNSEGSNGNGNGNRPGNSGLVQDSFIGEKRALEIALDDSKKAVNELTQQKVKLDEEDGVIVYEIKLKTANEKFEYEINAQTGEILKSEHKTTKIKNCE